MILLGVLCSLPILFIIIGLLTSADGVFKEVFDTFFSKISFIFSRQMILSILGRIIVIVAVSVYLVCILYNIINKNSAFNKNHTAKSLFGIHVEDTIINTILTILNFVYLIFSLVQLFYVYSYITRQMPMTATFNLAEYARQGFFQLMWVTFINFIVILLTNSNHQKEELPSKNTYTKWMNVMMSLFTIVIAISAFLRMYLYEREYGYTFLRLMVYFILATEIIMILPTIYYIIKGKMNLFKTYFIIATSMYLVVNFVNIDALIARNNINRYIASNLQNVDFDVRYLTNQLGTDAVGEMVRVYDILDKRENLNNNQEMVRQRLNSYLIKQKVQLDNKTNLQEFNLARNHAKKELEKVTLKQEESDYYSYRNYYNQQNNSDSRSRTNHI